MGKKRAERSPGQGLEPLSGVPDMINESPIAGPWTGMASPPRTVDHWSLGDRTSIICEVERVVNNSYDLVGAREHNRRTARRRIAGVIEAGVLLENCVQNQVDSVAICAQSNSGSRIRRQQQYCEKFLEQREWP